MILQALSNYYQRLLARGEEGLAPFGYSPEKISYAILLAPDGRVVDVADVRDTSGKKPMPRLMNVPQPEKRTVGIKSNFLWDKSSYVLGVSATSKRADKENEAFKKLHLSSLAGTHDVGLSALLAFLGSWTPEQFASAPFTPDMLDANLVFRLDGESSYLHERPAAQGVRASLLAVGSGEDKAPLPALGHCLVSGERSPIARLHPAIKGVTGAQSSGASIVSFNLESFTSYGKEQGANAPVSEQAAFAYTTVLNHLLRRSEHNRQRLQLGDTSVVCWAEAASEDEAQAAEDLLADVWNWDDAPTDGQENAQLRAAIEKLARGVPLQQIDPRLRDSTRVYVLGLAPNASRISIRFWHMDSLGALAENVVWHGRDMRLEPAPWKTWPTLWRLALATAPSRDGRAKSEDIPPNLTGELMRAILSGQRYPGSLLANTLMRMRTDGDLSGVRVAICKATLARHQRLTASSIDPEKEIPVSLDRQSTSPGYRLGRLFAVLEAAQRAALGGQVNATIRDRYYGAASATPASIFPMLLRNTQNHLGKLRKDKPGLAIGLEKDIREIVEGLSDSFPRSLHIEEQGRFAIGYYHQSQSRFNKDKPAGGSDADTETDSVADANE